MKEIFAKVKIKVSDDNIHCDKQCRFLAEDDFCTAFGYFILDDGIRCDKCLLGTDNLTDNITKEMLKNDIKIKSELNRLYSEGKHCTEEYISLHRKYYIDNAHIRNYYKTM